MCERVSLCVCVCKHDVRSNMNRKMFEIVRWVKQRARQIEKEKPKRFMLCILKLKIRTVRDFIQNSKYVTKSYLSVI